MEPQRPNDQDGPTSGSKTSRNRWAVLIGVNFHPDPNNRLHGCVRDVNNIKACLREGPTPVTIVTMTASNSEDSNFLQPIEAEQSWPTYDHVIASLQQITRDANEGDFVYIHYSGHGTQVEPIATDNRHEGEKGDLALVLVGTDQGNSYLRGRELAHHLNLMVKKRLRVTMVLDCCFSGSVPRQGSSNSVVVRTIDHQVSSDSAMSQELRTGLGHSQGTPPFRDARIVPGWLVNPEGYSILAASGPHERAYELVKAGKRYGALSYFLCRALSSLRKSGTEISFKSLYQHLCVQFHVYYPQQSPMRYGNAQDFFFGVLESTSPGGVAVFRRLSDDQLCLAAGCAHGVCKDDEYALFKTPEDISSKRSVSLSIQARVSTVHDLTSELVPANPSSSTSEAKIGWRAKPCSHLPSRRVSVRLLSSIRDPHQWIAAAEHRKFIVVPSTNAEVAPCLFSVEQSKGSEYRIMDGEGQRISSLPAIPSNDSRAVNSVLDLLEHLTTFKYIEGIENRNPNALFENSFHISLSDAVGRDCAREGILRVTHKNYMRLIIRNKSTKALYVAILNLCPSWKITNLVDEDGGGEYMIVLPRHDFDAREELIKLSMEVPGWARERGLTHCEDVIKVFITDQPTSFAPLLLPEVSRSKPGGQYIRGHGNALSHLLSQLGNSFRSAGHDMEACWTTRNFIVVTEYYDSDS